MRITTSGNYFHGYGCDLYDCERLYCQMHRWLYRTCESVPDWDERGKCYSNECQRCRDDYETKKLIRIALDRGDKVGEEYLERYGFKKAVGGSAK